MKTPPAGKKRKKEPVTAAIVPEPVVSAEPVVAGPRRLQTMKIHEELGFVSHRHPDQFLAVRLVGVRRDHFFVLDEERKEEMEISRATGHRRYAPEGWDFWCLPEEDLAALNRSEWKS